MKPVFRRLVLLAAIAAASPSFGAWEELRKDDTTRLSIDPKTIRTRGPEISFKYLVDFRGVQGDFKTAQYRSLVIRAAVRCAPRTFAQREIEAYTGNEAQGPMVGVMKPTREQARFQKVEVGTSDEDLLKRVCATPARK